jgi:glycosyltransferase involved in cell wall biosynthesis/SAM-dependent methyltransferase
MKFNIVIVTSGLDFNGNTDREKALGGSETAVINVARELAKQGHYVRVFCKCSKEGIYDNVFYYDVDSKWNSFITHGECDIAIVSRHYSYLAQYKINSKLNILWNHDILVDEKSLIAALWQFDYGYCLTNYHRTQYIDKVKDMGQMLKIIPNGVDETLLKNLPKEKKHKIMFTSRPERGLFQALQIYEQYGDKDLEFLICNYASVSDKAVQELEHYCSLKIADLIGRGFNIKIDRFAKQELYNNIAESKAVLYPTNFPEVFCISAIEAQFCNTAFITTDDFSLTEVVGYERCKQENNEYLTMLMKVLKDDKYRESLEKKGRKHVSKYTWENVAQQFVDDAVSHFEVRSRDTKRILQRMIYESDLEGARECITKHYGGHEDLLKRLNHDLRFCDEKDSYEEIYEDTETHEKAEFEQLIKVPRLQWLSKQVAHHKLKSVLSVGCHTGTAEILASNENKGCKVTGYDLSKQIIERANKEKDKFAEHKENINFIHQLDEYEQYDALYLGEVLEHVTNPEEFLTGLEKHVKDGGKVLLTLPRGAWEWLSHEQNIKKDVVYHVQCYDFWDLHTMFGKKKDLDIVEYHDGNATGYYQEPIGNYLVSYTKDSENEIVKRDFTRKMLTNRPYQSISACIIARNAEQSIEKLLDSIHYEMDEIIIGIDHDKGECDEFIRRIEAYPKVKWFYLSKRIVKDKLGFAAARNETVEKATSEWIFWVDTDEVLLKREPFRKYLDTTHFHGFNILQQHPQLDNFLEADKPQRLFRKSKGRFVGYIHEQVQDIEDINKGVDPTVILSDCHVLNFGEIHEGVRRNKAMGRNLELLQKDILENVDNREKAGKPVRYMSIILLMRDFINRIIYSIEQHKRHDTRDIKERSLPKIYGLYGKYFHKMKGDEYKYYKELAYGMVQRAMDLAQEGEQVTIKLGEKEIKKRVSSDNLKALEAMVEEM